MPNAETNADPDSLRRYTNCPPRHFSRWRFWWYLFVLRFISNPLLMLTFRPRVFGRQNVPAIGPFIVVSNHVNAFDPFFVARAVGYPVAFMAKKELFRYRFVGEAIRLMGSFALDRDNPSSSTLKTAFNVLKSRARWALGMFPEGTRSRTGSLLPLKKGVGGLAVKTGSPVLPIGIHRGMAGRFIVTVGEVIADDPDPEVVHTRIHESLLHLVDPGWDRVSKFD